MVFATKQLFLCRKVANDQNWPFRRKIAKYAWKPQNWTLRCKFAKDARKRLICRFSNLISFFSLFWQILSIQAKNLFLDRFRREKELDGICHKTACFEQKANKWPTLIFSVQNHKVRFKTANLSNFEFN